MMWRRDVTTLALGLIALGCSGRYEVGGMHGSSGSSGSGGQSEPPLGVGGTAMVAGGAGGQVSSCVYSGDVPELAGPFASPGVVWQRIAPLIWGRDAEPPSPLPVQTTYEWAGNVALQGLAQAAATHDSSSSENAVPGARPFLRRLLRVAEETPLGRDWNVLLSANAPVLRVLLFNQVDTGPRVGIFTEPAWLQAHAGISSRGNVMVEALFGASAPPPPVGIEPTEAMDGLTRRQRLEQQVSNPTCAACHRIFDPLGVSLEHFGADGNYRTLEGGLAVDSADIYEVYQELGPISFDDHIGLSSQLFDECRVKQGFASSFLRIAIEKAGTPEQGQYPAVEANEQRIQQAFVRGGLTYVALVRAFAQSPAALRP